MADKFTSPREIAELNVAHYSKLLRTPLDEQTRAIVERLLAEEQTKLAKLAKQESLAPRGSSSGACEPG